MRDTRLRRIRVEVYVAFATVVNKARCESKFKSYSYWLTEDYRVSPNLNNMGGEHKIKYYRGRDGGDGTS